MLRALFVPLVMTFEKWFIQYIVISKRDVVFGGGPIILIENHRAGTIFLTYSLPILNPSLTRSSILLSFRFLM